MRIASICVQEEGSYDAQHFTMLLEILSPDIKTKEDLVKAVNAACTDFVKTEEGKKIYEYNCKCFNWTDFESKVPDSICEKHGFKKIRNPKYEIEFTVNWDEHLVDDFELEEK